MTPASKHSNETKKKMRESWVKRKEKLKKGYVNCKICNELRLKPASYWRKEVKDEARKENK